MNIVEEEGGDDLIVDPLLKYLPLSCHCGAGDYLQQPTTSHHYFDVEEAIEALKTKGYYHIPAVLTHAECDEALNNIWDFIEDVSGGCVQRNDPLSWYPQHEVCIGGKKLQDTDESVDSPIISTNPKEHDDLDPWPHTGYASFPDLFQSLGSGYVLGEVRAILAERVFEPLYGTRELLCSKEGFTFCRPLVVDLENKKNDRNGDTDGIRQQLVWQPSFLNSRVISSNGVEMKRPQYKVCGKPQQLSQGHHYDQGVPISVVKLIKEEQGGNDAAIINDGISKKQKNKMQKTLMQKQKLKDLAGLCHIQASITFTDQTKDQHRGGGHFLCHPHSHSNVHWKLVGGTYRATPTNKEREDPTWVPVTDNEIQKLNDMGYPEKRVYASRGDVVLWRSDLVHAGVPPSLIVNNKSSENERYDGSREFRAVQYCCMLPKEAVSDYIKYSLPKHKLLKKGLSREETVNGALQLDLSKMEQLQKSKELELAKKKLEDYKAGRSGDQRPEVEGWHEHRRTTMWNRPHNNHHSTNSQQQKQFQAIPPRMLQRPRFRLGPPTLTVRQAELYGLIQYRQPLKDTSSNDLVRSQDIEHAVIRGVRFVEGVYKGRNGNDKEVESWAMKNGKYCSDEDATVINKHQPGDDNIPICLATMEVLTPRASVNGASSGLLGQDKYLGGMASPCGRYIWGVPGHAKRVVQVDTYSREVSFIGPEYLGEFKWLRGVEIPSSVMETNDDGSQSGCCLALPCNSKNGCVLKITPDNSEVSTFVTGDVSPNVNEGWLYHGGNLALDGFVYAIPASANRVMKIDPRKETTEYIGPEYTGKAKWYGGITGSDGCIYGIPHNATGVLKINPTTQEVTILAEGSLPEGRWKWHGGLASLDGTKIIGFPNNADSILIIDVPKQQVYTVGDTSLLRSGYHRVPQDGRYKYLGGSLTRDGRLAYLFPCDAEYVVRFDMETNEIKLVGPRLTEGENKFQNGFVGNDDCIYGIPQRSSGVLRIIPPGVKRYDRNGVALRDDDEYVDVIYCGDDMVTCKDKFEGGVLGFDGKIYCIPLRAKAFVNIIPGTFNSLKTMSN